MVISSGKSCLNMKFKTISVCLLTNRKFSSAHCFVLTHIRFVAKFLHFFLTISCSTSMSKLNNFTRLESSFHLLGISFDVSVAQALMQEKPGVAARLLYQLYFSLERKRTTQISGTIMEITQPAAIVGLHKKEQEIYSNVCVA